MSDYDSEYSNLSGNSSDDPDIASVFERKYGGTMNEEDADAVVTLTRYMHAMIGILNDLKFLVEEEDAGDKTWVIYSYLWLFDETQDRVRRSMVSDLHRIGKLRDIYRELLSFRPLSIIDLPLPELLEWIHATKYMLENFMRYDMPQILDRYNLSDREGNPRYIHWEHYNYDEFKDYQYDQTYFNPANSVEIDRVVGILDTYDASIEKMQSSIYEMHSKLTKLLHKRRKFLEKWAAPGETEEDGRNRLIATYKKMWFYTPT